VVTFDGSDLCCAAGRANLVEKFNIGFVIISPLLREVIFVINCFNRAYGLTSTTVHAFIRMNVKHAVTFIDAVHGTFINAGTVLYVDTGKGDDVGHKNSSKSEKRTVSSLVFSGLALGRF
jgi:hypothetical protein